MARISTNPDWHWQVGDVEADEPGPVPITEAMIGAHILPDADGEIAVLDLGASDGITTLELVAALRKVFGNRPRAYMPTSTCSYSATARGRSSSTVQQTANPSWLGSAVLDSGSRADGGRMAVHLI